MIKNIQAIRDHCASWDVSEVVEAAVSMLQKEGRLDVVQQVDTVGALM
jgi:ribosomal protein S8